MDKIEINEMSIDKLTGTYEFFPTLQYNNKKQGITIFENRENASAYQEILHKAIKIDSTSKYSINIKTTKDEILFNFYKDTTLVETKTIKGKLKNGFYHLDNSKIKCDGVPYLLGGCRQTKTRLGLSNNGDLIINQAYESSGAFLLFFWAGQEFNTCYFFKKIEF